MTKEEFMRQWAVDGMPADKIRLFHAAWDEATKEASKPVCFGLDDCSSNALSVCIWASECGNPKEN